MIKKILLLLLLFIFAFFIIFYFIDKIYINKIITNLEKQLNINIILKEPHNFDIIPNLRLSKKFDLDNKNKNFFVQGAQIIIEKDYNNQNAKFNFNLNNFTINKLIVEDLNSLGEINQYNFKNLLKFTAFSNGYFYYNLNEEEKYSLKFINLIIKRINVPKIYKKLSDLSLSFLNEKSFFTSDIKFDNEIVIINNFESKKQNFNLLLKIALIFT